MIHHCIDDATFFEQQIGQLCTAQLNKMKITEAEFTLMFP